MTTEVDTFTSTGQKILKHPDLINYMNQGKIRPQSLQLAPTNKCNLKCSFCSVAKRKLLDEIPVHEVFEILQRFREYGTETVEISGGGEPMLHPAINEIILQAYSLGYKIGLITNGTLLDKLLHPKHLDWLRISANSLDYNKEIFIPKLRPDAYLGFSYCFDYEGDSTIETLLKIKDLAIKHNARYVRVVPNCIGDVEKRHQKIKDIVEKLGKPLFYQEKRKDVFNNCWIGYLKPFLNADGYVYPCSSTVLNEDAERQFNPKYRWYHWRDMARVYGANGTRVISPVDGSRCADCVFTGNNRLYDCLIKETHKDCDYTKCPTCPFKDKDVLKEYLNNKQDCEKFL